ncbi:hypothetical protein PBY51_018718 [Eleginops maclovinus]|uniref:Uncharacterized protein n=1 Tax=Eleginops maclovinus TaxID=56733 RepID=A0AAN7YAK5_ELEMC|nr:hypothetical protein PBY51_018718 [Eleginops maclovinus]
MTQSVAESQSAAAWRKRARQECKSARERGRYQGVNEALQFGSEHSFIILGSCLGGKHDWANVALFQTKNTTDSQSDVAKHAVGALPTAFYLIN